jgi:hypothetical protein
MKPKINQEKSNNVLVIALGIVIVFLLMAAAAGWALYLKEKLHSKLNQKLSPPPGATEQCLPAPPTAVPTSPSAGQDNQNQNITEQPGPYPQEGYFPPTASAKNMGYLKKVYAKNGKNFIDVDYIQWLDGAEAEKAMREDGQCPKTGECVVYDDYYIRNQNPMVRSLEVAPEAEIRMLTLESETTGRVDQIQVISFEKLKNIFNPGSTTQQRYQFTPFIIEFVNNKIVKITEQYIP